MIQESHDLLKILLVRDMWLSGFDAPSLHRMYVDKLVLSQESAQCAVGLLAELGGNPLARGGRGCHSLWQAKSSGLKKGSGD